MNRELRRKDREVSREEAYKVLVNGEYGFLGTLSQDGYPYITPLSYIIEKDAVYFHCALEGHKLDNLKQHPQVSFCVVGNTEVLPDKFSTNYESVVIFGKAYIVHDAEERKSALISLIRKYSDGFIEEGTRYIEKAAEKTAIVRIDIESISGKARR